MGVRGVLITLAAFSLLGTGIARADKWSDAVGVMVKALKDSGAEGVDNDPETFNYEAELASLKGKNILKYARLWLKSGNQYLRAASAFLYGRTPDKKIYAPLDRMLRNDKSSIAAAAAADALGRFGEKHGAKWLRDRGLEALLVKILRDKKEPWDVRAATARALVASKSSKAFDTIKAALSPRMNKDLAVSLMESLGKRGTRAAAQLLLKVAGDQRYNEEVRNEALVQAAEHLRYVDKKKYFELAAKVEDEDTGERLVQSLIDKTIGERDAKVLAGADDPGLRLLGLKAQGKVDEALASEEDSPLAVLNFLAAWAGTIKDPKLARRIAERALAMAENAEEGTEIDVLKTFERVRGALPKELKPEFDHVIREKMKERALARYRKKDTCEAACDLAKNKRVWSRPEFLRPPDVHHANAWEMAMRSLGAAFLAKAAPFCEPAKERWDELRKNWLGLPDCTAKKLAQVERGLRTTRALNKKRKRPAYVHDVFAEQYYSLLLRESLKDKTLSKTCREALTARLKAAEDSHATYLGAHAKSESDINDFDSLYTSYAIAASVLSLGSPPERMLKKMRGVVRSVGDPTLIPYYPKKESETSRSAAARSPVFLLALYFNAPDGAEKEIRRKELLKTVRNYALHVPSLSLHVGREETHVGDDDLAPYYFYSTIPYAIASTRLLIQRSRDDKEKQELEEILGELSGTLLGMIEEKSVRPEKFEVSSPAYANPLAGLALLAVKSCVAGAVETELGIVPAELERKDGTPERPAAVPTAHTPDRRS